MTINPLQKETPVENPPQSLSPPGESQRIKAEIARFLREERLQPKLEKLKNGDDVARQKLLEEHQPTAWIADAARRVLKIQQATHAIKFTHPSADGSSISCKGNAAAQAVELGTHTLLGELVLDVVSNDAKNLDVYKFLQLTIDGRTLLDRALARDPALIEAFAEDAAQASAWVDALATLPQAKGRPASHTLAKQLYWPVSDDAYHLLSPLFASSLAHSVHRRINDSIFSEDSIAAKKAWKDRQSHGSSYRYYPNLVIQKFGGSQSQNISVLNSKRRSENRRWGDNYLLASVPPNWESDPLRPPLKTETVFAARRYFGWRKEVRRLTRVLREYLRDVADATSNLRIRETRRQLVADIVDQALQMAAELRQLEPGWSAQAECQLNLAEQCWLDPERNETDEDFAARYRRGDWKDEVCLRFANWLNASLQTDKTFFGGTEALEWKTLLADKIKLLREDLGDD